MGSYGTVWEPSATRPHIHSLAAGDGGQLSTNLTRITNFSPLALVVALG